MTTRESVACNSVDPRHRLGTYPGRLYPPLARRVLAELGEEGRRSGLVLDPFVGSGTVLLEAARRGYGVAGADPNPYARLLTRVKLQVYDPQTLQRAANEVVKAARKREWSGSAVAEGWYSPAVLDGLGRIGAEVQIRADPALGDPLRVALAACANSLSLQDPRIPVPVRIKLEGLAKPGSRQDSRRARHDRVTKADPYDAFIDAVGDLSAKVGISMPYGHRNPTLYADACSLPSTMGADVIVTSPPYGPAQKYVRATQLALSFLGLPDPEDQKPVHQATIGRERHLPNRADRKYGGGVASAESLLDRVKADALSRIWGTYFTEVEVALGSAVEAMRPGATFVLIAGGNVVEGQAFDTSGYLVEVLKSNGLTVGSAREDPLRGWSLLSSRKGSAPRLAAETVTVLYRPRD